MSTFVLLQVRSIFRQNEEWDKKLGNLEFGQFLFLYLLARNVEYNVYKKVLECLMETGPKISYPDLELANFDPSAPTKADTLRLASPLSSGSHFVDGNDEEIDTQK